MLRRVLLMIIDDLNFSRAGRLFGPREANPPLVINADAVLALPVTFERFKPVTRQSCKVFQTRGCIQSVKTKLGLSGKTGKFPDPLAICEASGLAIPVADDHWFRT